MNTDRVSDQKFQSFAHAWATGVIAAALQSSETFSCDISSEAPEMFVRLGARRFRVIVEELQ